MASTTPAPPLDKQLTLEVIGSDLQGKQFFVRTRTVAVHANGVSIRLAKKLAIDSELIVRNSETDQEAAATVVEQSPDEHTGNIYRLAYLDSPAEVRRPHIPSPEPAKVLRLKCSTCHSISPHPWSEIDLEIFASTGELIRYCETCNSSSLWNESTPEGAATHSSHSSGPAQSADSPIAPIGERRQNRRTAIKASACLRYAGTELIVECEDISKAGFRFQSSKEYPTGTRVEAAVPYTKSSTNIFCPASIAYCQKLPTGDFRHGANYVKRRGSPGWEI